ncbi:MAG: 2'-5' RNA ligase family protein [Planctomycetota bacterium]|jgi:2'-5' RNA ligase
MKAAITLFPDLETANFVRKLGWDLHLRYGIGTLARRVPPHVTLKQPFVAADLARLEEYVDELAQSIAPLDVRLSTLGTVEAEIEGNQAGIVWLEVEETPRLRALHDRINAELNARFGDTPAPYDGESYRFHITVSIGRASIEAFRTIEAELSGPLDRACRLGELALLVYEEPLGPGAEFMTYKVLPLEGSG